VTDKRENKYGNILPMMKRSAQRGERRGGRLTFIFVGEQTSAPRCCVRYQISLAVDEIRAGQRARVCAGGERVSCFFPSATLESNVGKLPVTASVPVA